MTTVANVAADVRGKITRTGPAVASFTRPADTTAYGANDVVSDSAAVAAALAFKGAGRSGKVLACSFGIDAIVVADFDVWLFDEEPTNFLDNAALALVAADMPRVVDVYSFLTADFLSLGGGGQWGRQPTTESQTYGQRSYATADGIIYGLLVTSGFTPASGTKFTIKLHLERDLH